MHRGVAAFRNLRRWADRNAGISVEKTMAREEAEEKEEEALVLRQKSEEAAAAAAWVSQTSPKNRMTLSAEEAAAAAYVLWKPGDPRPPPLLPHNRTMSNGRVFFARYGDGGDIRSSGEKILPVSPVPPPPRPAETEEDPIDEEEEEAAAAAAATAGTRKRKRKGDLSPPLEIVYLPADKKRKEGKQPEQNTPFLPSSSIASELRAVLRQKFFPPSSSGGKEKKRGITPDIYRALQAFVITRGGDAQIQDRYVHNASNRAGGAQTTSLEKHVLAVCAGLSLSPPDVSIVKRACGRYAVLAVRREGEDE